MTCEEFKSRLEERGSRPFIGLPKDLAEHRSSCADCRLFVREEIFWHRFFAASTAPSPSRSLWPGILSRIQEQLERRESFSASFVLFGRRLAPVFALLLIIASGVTLWRASGVEAQDRLTMIAMVEEDTERIEPIAEEPEVILASWLGSDQEE